MTEIRIETKGATAAHRAIVAGLKAYNKQHLGKRKAETKLVLTARDETGALIGGLVGYCYLELLYVHLLWVAEAHRGNDIGTKLIKRAESEAGRLGARMIRLESESFQAPGFYLKLGYREFGRLDDLPKGHVTHFYVKSLE